MSNGAMPKRKSSRSSLGHQRDEVNIHNSCSELFELTPKPKLTCIPENCRKLFDDLRKTQSLNVNKKVEYPEKSCSVLFIGSKKLAVAHAVGLHLGLQVTGDGSALISLGGGRGGGGGGSGALGFVHTACLANVDNLGLLFSGSA
uniref:Uncharacterized protein n=1 Tax=Glossina palpalis gambiensis TaxID=67801 RepID=A0A1B0B6U4_9MUSC